MGSASILLTARWIGEYCGRHGNDGKPVAGGCDFHEVRYWKTLAEEQTCHRFAENGRPWALVSEVNPIRLAVDEGGTRRCEACLAENKEF